MAVLSKVALDARAGAHSAAAVAAGTDLLLRQATQISADDARAWAQKRPQDGRLTALVDLPEAARLKVPAWLAALAPDIVELRTPAWTQAGMDAIGWPAGYAVLQRALQALLEANVATRVALHVSALTLAELTPTALDALAKDVGVDALTLVLRPVLGDAAPPLDKLAVAVTALCQASHAVTAARLLPACALPEGIDGEATFASERAAAHQEFTTECAGCPARDAGRCDGMVADLLRATRAAGVTWCGWETLATEREPVAIIAESIETLDEMAIRLGLRRVWRSELPLADSEVLGAHPPSQLVVIAGAQVTLDSEATTQFDLPGTPAQILYLAHDQADAEAARDAETATTSTDPEQAATAHRELGRLLGAPECCVVAAQTAITARGAGEGAGLTGHALAVLQAGRASQVLDRRLNFGSAIDDACLLRHVPCAFDCAASLTQVAELEAELARVAPGRLTALLALRVDAALVFADGAHLPLRGERDADGSLRNPKVATDWDGNTPRGHVAQRAYEVVADQLVHAAVLTSSQPFTGTGGVIVTGDDGSQAPLEIGSLTAHPEFPRLIVFAAQS